jgi:hypothetical protein
VVEHFVGLLRDRGDRAVSEKRRQGFYQSACRELMDGRRLDDVVAVIDWLFGHCGGELPAGVIQDPAAYMSGEKLAQYRAGKGVRREFKRRVTSLRHVFCHFDELMRMGPGRDESTDSGFESLRSRMEKSQTRTDFFERQAAQEAEAAQERHRRADPATFRAEVAALNAAAREAMRHRAKPAVAVGVATDVATDMSSRASIEERRRRYAARAAASHRDSAPLTENVDFGGAENGQNPLPTSGPGWPLRPEGQLHAHWWHSWWETGPQSGAKTAPIP